MPWTITNWWLPNQDVFTADTYNEFASACNERAKTIGPLTLYPPYAAGHDAHIASEPFFGGLIYGGFRGWQIQVDYLKGWYVVSHDGGVERAAGYYNGAPTILWYATTAEMFQATDLPHTNWRRYTTHPDDGGVVEYGYARAGDILGPWLFEDIQKTLNVLRWTRLSGDSDIVVWDSKGEANTKSGGGGGANEAAAKAAALVAYAAAAPVSLDAYEPRARSKTVAGWAATLVRAYSYALLTHPGVPPVSRDIDFYARSYAYDAGEWDANGDGVLEGVFRCFSTINDTLANPVYSDRLGNLALPTPNWSPNPGPVSRGYVAGDPNPVLSEDDRVAVERWDFDYQ